MTTSVFAMVLGAAFLHAAWNALVKVNVDRLVLIAIMVVSQIGAVLLFLPFVAFPPAAAWPHIWASTAIHTGYFMFLALSYRFGDLSHVYPIARGSAPLIVAAVSVAIIGETLSREAMLSVLVIALGIMSLTLTRGASGFREPKAILFALGTGVFIAGYTVVDGLGARVAGSAHSYIVWLNLFNGLPTLILALLLRRGRFLAQARKSWKPGVVAGIVSLLAYWIVIWAAMLAPLAMVSAVRETGMVFAVLFGVFFLNERLNLARLVSIITTLFGVMFLKISR
ncbi:DMT family transporter [Defluviimonas sp. WL0024]|uniref:DMT family transporter n=1 Tax=Albidovulum salinarum TaxID=2984153 RepID=A0ABT2X5W3_9RHOB|nr:DMT family transporter [Defluviimonas sp. WL0024]MCU9849336.1 DMT family transporter [Defluviimonas sp. WL0024]